MQPSNTKNIEVWVDDLKAVYGKFWKDKERFHLSEDLWESPDGSVAALLYGIAEVGISKKVGRLAIFYRQDKPELVYNLPKLQCWYLYDSAVQFGHDGLLFIHQFKPGRKVMGVEVMVLDASTNRCAVIAELSRNFQKIRYINGTIYGFTEMSGHNSVEKIVDLKNLSWKPINGNDKFFFDVFIPRLFAWMLPLLITAVYAVVLYLFSQTPVKGTVDLGLPDGPLANETNLGPIWHSLAYAGPVFVAYALMLWRFSHKRILAAANAFWLFCWVLALLILSPLVFMGLNSVLDHSRPVVYTVDIVDKYESVDVNTAANPAWRLTLSSWRPHRNLEILPVSKDEFDRAQPGKDRILLWIKPGHFGYPWIESYEMLPENVLLNPA